MRGNYWTGCLSGAPYRFFSLRRVQSLVLFLHNSVRLVRERVEIFFNRLGTRVREQVAQPVEP